MSVASVSDILGHLCWESETVSQTVVGNAGSGLEESHGVTEFMLPYFRALIELAKLSDSLQVRFICYHLFFHAVPKMIYFQKKRVEWIMESIFSCMELQARYTLQQKNRWVFDGLTKNCFSVFDHHRNYDCKTSCIDHLLRMAKCAKFVTR